MKNSFYKGSYFMKYTIKKSENPKDISLLKNSLESINHKSFCEDNGDTIAVRAYTDHPGKAIEVC